MQAEIEPKIASWQSEHYEIGFVHFYPCEEVTEQFPFYKIPADSVFIAMVESDALCLLVDGTLAVYDHEVPNRILCRAAVSQLAFIAALQFLEESCRESSSNFENSAQGATENEVGSRCASIAGGNDYREFYCALIG